MNKFTARQLCWVVFFYFRTSPRCDIMVNMDWAQKRKIIFGAGFAGIIILLAAYPAYLLFRSDPTCGDKKQNGSEISIDCGGLCARACLVEIVQPSALWAKALPLGGTKYDLVAYIENPNTSAGVKNAQYSIRALDSSGSVLAEKKGVTELVPGFPVLLFETGAELSEPPSRVEVVFDTQSISEWFRATVAQSSVSTKNQSLKNVDTKPRFDAVLVNNDPINEVAGLSISAIVYDSERRPVAASKTYVAELRARSEQNIFFTWPNRFTKYARGERCLVSVGITATSTMATTTATTTPDALCATENFTTEIIITPRAIFAE